MQAWQPLCKSRRVQFDIFSYRPHPADGAGWDLPQKGIAMHDIDEVPYLVAIPPSGQSIPATGTVDDDDEPEDESEDENEAPVGETSDATETPEEFKGDDENPA
jgi:hypothetical protein